MPNLINDKAKHHLFELCCLRMSSNFNTSTPSHCVTGEEITNANHMDSNVNDKSAEFTCYKLLWLSRGNGKKPKIIIIFENRAVSFHIDQF